MSGRLLRAGGAVAQRTLALVVLVGLWQLAAVTWPSNFFPPPSEIGTRMYELWLSAGPPVFFTPAVAEDIVPSLGRMCAGWAIAAVVGILAGVAIGRSRLLRDATAPVVNFTRSIPVPALLPVFLILFGGGTSMRVLFIAFGTVWPVLLNTIDGVRTVEPIQLETAQAFGLSRRARFRRVVIPAAMPKIMAGLRIATAYALILMVLSELTAASDGIGHEIASAQRYFQLTDLWAGIVLLALVGFVLNLAFRSVESRALRWHEGAHQRD